MNDFKILKNSYFDSVTLMSTTVSIKNDMNLSELVMFMGTDMNKEMIKSVGLYHVDMDQAEPNDLIIACTLNQENKLWADEVIKRLSSRKKTTQTQEKVLKTIPQAKEQLDANLAVISVPGIYAAHEAFKALENNMHVMLFSDNVSIEDELALKKLGQAKDLLVMGPDCGTAIINGKGLCFANQVNRGPIGLVAASGTGLQEVTVIIDRFHGGITQAIGVGGRDLSEQVGGIMMLKGIDALDRDPNTQVIVLISKPPHKSVDEAITNRLKTITKPVVVCFLDAKSNLSMPGIHFVSTLTEAAIKALSLCDIQTPSLTTLDQNMLNQISSLRKEFKPNQHAIKGLFCGGTLTAETLSVLRPFVGHLTSNVAKKPEEKMKDPLKSEGHNLVDLGDDIFTQGKPHPMIEPSIRNERILLEAKQPETAVILLDFELGIGSHSDPVGVTLPAIEQAYQIAKQQGKKIVFVAYVCGTQQDHQGLTSAEERLKQAGVILGQTNAHAAIIAAHLIQEGSHEHSKTI
jgi:FdrA protein